MEELSARSRDLWLQEVDYRRAVSSHLSLWRQRSNDLKGVTNLILEMEGACHQRLKDLLLQFLRKRHELFVGMRDLLDPAVDALESADIVSSIEDMNKRLEEAFLHLQPGKKRSRRILSLVSTTESLDIPSLSALSSLDEYDNRSKNVRSYTFAGCLVDGAFERCLVIVTRQHFLHVYRLPTDSDLATEQNQSQENEESHEVAVQAAMEAGYLFLSATLSSCGLRQMGSTVGIDPENDKTHHGEVDEADAFRIVLGFCDADEAADWLSGVETPFCTSTPETAGPEMTVVRI